MGGANGVAAQQVMLVRKPNNAGLRHR